MSDVYKAPEAELNIPLTESEFGSVEGALRGDFNIPVIDLLKQAWNSMDGLKMPMILGWLVYAGASLLFGGIQELVIPTRTPEQALANMLPSTLMQVGAMFLLTPLYGGLFMMAIKHAAGGKAEVSEIFRYYHKIVPLFFTILLTYLLVGLGLLLLIVPGLYLMVAFAMAMPLVLEKNMGPWEALMTSRKAVHHRWGSMLGFMFMSLLVILAGMIALLVGLIWALPCVMLAYALLYRNMFGVEPATLVNN